MEHPVKGVSGSKRTNIEKCYMMDDWYTGYGKCEGCDLEGTWYDMVCLARNILACENTKIVAPEYYHPEYENSNY